MQIQDQIYLVLIVTGSFILIFFISILVICCLMCYFKREIRDLQRINRERYAFNNPTIQPGEELSIRGFQMINSPGRLSRQQDGRYSADEPQLTRRSNNKSNNSQIDPIEKLTDFKKYRAALKHEKPRTQQSLERKTTDSVAVICEL
uniref:CSON011866 protein n=1 Tax=Culicoides sonorensis TaxID=179676 RepID=A0A336KKB4_CULSO